MIRSEPANFEWDPWLVWAVRQTWHPRPAENSYFWRIIRTRKFWRLSATRTSPLPGCSGLPSWDLVPMPAELPNEGPRSNIEKTCPPSCLMCISLKFWKLMKLDVGSDWYFRGFELRIWQGQGHYQNLWSPLVTIGGGRAKQSWQVDMDDVY